MYNEALNVEPLLKEVQHVLNEQFNTYEMVVVDDGSHDETSIKLTECQKTIPKIVWVKHQMNYKQSASILTGVHKTI